MFAFVKTPIWERADEDTKEGFAELIEHLGTKRKKSNFFLRRSMPGNFITR